MPEIFIASQLSLILEYLNPKIQIVGKNMFKNYASHLSLALNLYLIMVKIIDYSRNCEPLWKFLESQTRLCKSHYGFQSFQRPGASIHFDNV